MGFARAKKESGPDRDSTLQTLDSKLHIFKVVTTYTRGLSHNRYSVSRINFPKRQSYH